MVSPRFRFDGLASVDWIVCGSPMTDDWLQA